MAGGLNREPRAQRRDRSRQEREQQRRGLGYRGTRFILSGRPAPRPPTHRPIDPGARNDARGEKAKKKAADLLHVPYAGPT